MPRPKVDRPGIAVAEQYSAAPITNATDGTPV
jgi:hypothetical protein